MALKQKTILKVSEELKRAKALIASLGKGELAA
jgi:hypothetical protein